jgi:hypothetical protein
MGQQKWSRATQRELLYPHMKEKLLGIIFSLGFVKLVCDAGGLFWKKIFRQKIIFDVSVSYHHRNGEMLAKKSLFLVVHNRTEKDTAVCGFAFDDSWWATKFGRSHEKPFVIDRVIMEVPAGKSMQMYFEWMPANLVYPMRFFAVNFRGGRRVWARSKQWKRVLWAYLQDFPDWAKYKRDARPVEFAQYDGSMRQLGELKSEKAG